MSNIHKKMKKQKENKTVLILCAIIIMILCIATCAIIYSKVSESSGRYARIYQNGKLLYTIDLSHVGDTYTLDIYGEENQQNVVEVRKGEAGMVSASCPDQLCVKMGFTHTEAMPVTCLPNQVVIEISDDAPKEGEPDGVAY